jgi:hypothetical protein
MIATRQLSHRVPQLRINGMRKALILACSFATIATQALAVDPAKVAVMVGQMRADEQTAIEAADKAEVAESSRCKPRVASKRQGLSRRDAGGGFPQGFAVKNLTKIEQQYPGFVILLK